MDILKNRFLPLLLTVCLSFLTCVAFAATQNTPSLEVQQIHLSTSNAYLIKSDKLVLIDSGSKGDLVALQAALTADGVSIEKLAAVILTHGHADHAGLAAELRRRSGAQLIAGVGDFAMTSAGHNDDIKPTNLMAHLLKRFSIDPSYEAFTADVQIDQPLDLHQFGIAGYAVQMPGHTPGSLVVILDDSRAFVGDMMLGGWMGGALFADRAGEHYFQADAARNHQNIIELLKLPIHTFYLGHGGPVTRASVLKGFGLSDPLLVPATP